ncbi:MAG: DUF3298 and DUF4163 domain-containing protein [Bradyrhizobiaceae bacterium]|nr:DUF3298 and DUF4163 domain-containing protein [Bradyrhizobiaceae bacterium]
MRFLLACAVAWFAASAAFAQSPPMQAAVSVKSRAIEIQIDVDQRLRADKRLYESILAEAKRIAASQRKEADGEWSKDRTMFRNGPWSFERGYSFDAAAGPYISASVLEYSYTGGAHPNHRTTTILWDREQGRRASIAELFRETKSGGPTLTALAALIREEVAKEKRERDVDVQTPLEQDEWLSGIKPDLKMMGAPGLVTSTIDGKAAGIDFHFSPYDVGAYAEGDYGAFFPWQALDPLLTERARALFGGERMEEPTTRK